MTDVTGPNGNADATASDEQLSALLSAAERVQTSAKEAHLDFVAYLAEMTVLQIKHEIEQRAGPAA